MGWFGLVFLPKVGLDTTGSFFQQILGEVWLDKGGCILGDGHVFLLILFFLLPHFFFTNLTGLSSSSLLRVIATSIYFSSYSLCVIFFFGVFSHPVSEFFLSVLTGKIIICLVYQGS